MAEDKTSAELNYGGVLDGASVGNFNVGNRRARRVTGTEAADLLNLRSLIASAETEAYGKGHSLLAVGLQDLIARIDLVFSNSDSGKGDPLKPQAIKAEYSQIAAEFENLQSSFRYMRCYVWTSADVTVGRAIRESLAKALELYRIRLEEHGPEVLGSWMQEFILKPWRGVPSKVNYELYKFTQDLNSRLESDCTTRGVQQEPLVIELIKTLKDVDEAVIWLQGMIIVKYYQKFVVKTLTVKQYLALEHSEVPLDDPEAVLAMLGLSGKDSVNSGHTSSTLSSPSSSESALP